MMPYDNEGLWRKALLFINRSTEPGDARTPDEAMLWAAMSLEMLAKAALAKLNPLLIADPMDDGKSVLLAAGVGGDPQGFKSIAAKTAFSRCARAFPPFDGNEATKIATTRNDELHSANVPYGSLHRDTWWQRFWALAALLLTAQDKSLDDYVGPDGAKVAEEYLARNRESVKERTRGLIERARQRRDLIEKGTLSTRVARGLQTRISYQQDYEGSAECPACGDDGTITGDSVIDSEIVYDEEYGPVMELVEIAADNFTCDTCGLVLAGPDFVAEANLPTSFKVEQDYEPEGEEYMNE